MIEKKEVLRLLKRTVRVFGTAIIVYLLMLFFAQKAIIYPGAYFSNSKLPKGSVLQLQQIDLVGLDNNPIKLYKLASPQENTKALLVFHGNADTAENMINRLYNPYVLYFGYDIYAMEYRGFTDVEGTPSEENILSDSKIVMDYIDKGNYKTTVYYGHSLGTGVAVNLARENTPDALILEAPFSSLKDMAHAMYPFIPRVLVDLMVQEKYDSLETLKNIEIKNILILNAKDDEVIPYEQGKKLYEAANSPGKLFVNYDRGGHNDIFLVNNIGDVQNFLLQLN